MKILSGNSNKKLSDLIGKHAGTKLSNVILKRFADGEIMCQIDSNIRGDDVFIIQSTSNPANDNLMELLIMVDAAVRASAARVTAVIPYFGYARQDRKSASRTPITAKLIANMLESAGVDRILTCDLHAGQIQGFFNIPVDDLTTKPLFVEDLKSSPMAKAGNLTIVSPDAGGVSRARAFAERLDAHIAIIDKKRERANESEAMNVIGDVKNKQCIIVDDIIDTGGTLMKAADALLSKGAVEVSAYITHGVLSNEGSEKIQGSQLNNLVISDTVPVKQSNGIKVISVAPLFAEAIRRVHNDETLSILFK